jgi:hypothetical protein
VINRLRFLISVSNFRPPGYLKNLVDQSVQDEDVISGTQVFSILTVGFRYWLL